MNYQQEYDEYWSRSAHWGNHSFENPTALADQIERICGRGPMLDVGCGMGLLVQTLVGRGVEARGMDIAQRVVDEGNRILSERFQLGSILSLPFGDESFDTVISTDCLEHIAEADVANALQELHRVSRRFVFVQLATIPDRDGRWRLTIRDRAWWEGQFFNAGFRKHPLSQLVVSYEELESEKWQVTLVFEKIPTEALARYPLSALKEERDLHMDMLRESGRRSDAHIARYMLAREYLPKAGVVLDAACGLGYGSALLAQFGGPNVRVIGLDLSDYAVDYARANFSPYLPNTEFHQGDAVDLGRFADASLDFVASFETVEHLREPEKFLAEVRRVLKPGGRFLCSVPNMWVDETGKDPNPWHFHVYDSAAILRLCRQFLEVSGVFSQTAGGGMKLSNAPRWMRRVNLPVTNLENEAEWWLVAAEKTPALPKNISAAAAGRHIIVLADNLQNPLYASWLGQCPLPVKHVPSSAGANAVPSDALLLVTHDTYTEPGRSIIRSAVARGIPTLILADGVLEYRNTFEHPQLDPGVVFQPVLGHKIACIGQAQTRVLESWGNAGRCETVGATRLDHYFSRSRRQRKAGEPVRVLITTALTPWFTAGHRDQVLASLRDLKHYFDHTPVSVGQPAIQPVWRLMGGVAAEMGLPASANDFSGRELAEVLQEVDAVITTPSTILLEAMLLGLPVAQLDYCNVPHYVSTAWRITAATHIPGVLSELANPPAAKRLYQETVLHEQLECAAPAAPRLLELIVKMVQCGLEAGRQNQPVNFPAAILPAGGKLPALVENRFNLPELYQPLGQFQPVPPPSRVVPSVSSGSVLPAVSGQRAKILFISHDASRTGAPYFLLHLLRWLKANTTASFKLLLRNGGPLEPEFRALGETFTPESFGRDGRNLADVGLIYSNTCTNGELVESLPVGDRPVVTHVHELGRAISDFGEKNWNAVQRQTTHYFACAGAVVEVLTQRYGIHPQKISRHYEGIPVANVRERAKKASAQQIRAVLGLPENAFLVGACGSVDKRKGADLFVQLGVKLSQVSSPDRRIALMWIGRFWNETDQRELLGEIQRLNLGSTVFFVGEQENPFPCLNACDAFVLTSREDPFPLVMLEAAALGKPLVCFEGSGGAPEFCKMGGGLAVPSLDIAAMAHAFQDLMNHPARGREIGRCAAELAVAHFDIAAISERIWKELQQFPRATKPEDLLSRTGSLVALGQTTEAVQLLRDGIQSRPQDAGLRLELGMLLLRMGDQTGAIGEMTEVHRLQPSNLDVAKVLASLLIDSRRVKEAAVVLGKVVHAAPSDVTAWMTLGHCFLQAGDRATAFTCFNEVLRLQPAHAEARALLNQLGAKSAPAMTLPTPPSQSAPAACPVCRGAALPRLSKSAHDYYCCQECGTVFTLQIDTACLRTENNGHTSRHNPAIDFERLRRLEDACGQPVRRMVDFGCGQGEFVALMRQRGIQCDGVDKETNLQLRDLPDGSLDGITMVEVIEHLYQPHPIFQEFQRVLRPGGAVYIESSFADGQDLAAWPYLDPAIGHCTVHTERSMQLLASNHGFTLLKLNNNVYVMKKNAVVGAGPVIEPVSPTVSAKAPAEVAVSIVIPVFNKVELTRQCLARLAANPCTIPHEIIVVDDHSTDETESFCRAQLPQQPNLRYHRLPENRGFGRACNHGANNACGRWVVFLNNDTEPEAGWLEAAVARLQSDPTIGVLGAKLLYPDRTVQHCGIEFCWADNPDYKIWPLHRHLGVPEHDPKANTADQVAAVTGACLFIERDLFASIGGFSPEYRMYFEDTDLCFKVWQAGRKVFYEPKCVVVHYESQSSPNRERVDALNRESGEIFFKKWPGPLAKIAFESSLEKSDGRYNYFRREVLSTRQDLLEAPDLEKVARFLVQLFHEVGPFYMHFGGAGDALLLLATFLDRHPDAQIISFCNSIPATRSFFDAFPSLKRVWFLPKNENPQFHILLRMMMRHCATCLGMGTTPEGDYFKDWHAGLDIFREMKVSRNPDWARKFRVNPQPKHVVLAPKGSLCGMVGSKRNIIDPVVWPQLVQLLCKRGFQPVIIGTPDEAEMYPCLEGCEDRRSFSFREQMEHIANSALLIGADSWAKTFSALAGIPTIVFEPLKGADWKSRKDASDYVFLDPWETITVVKDFEQCRRLVNRFVRGNLTAKPVKARPASFVTVAWEGSFLDYGSLSHVNRELTRRLADAGNIQLHCVNAPALPKGAVPPGDLKGLANALVSQAPTNTQVTVRHAWPPNWQRPAGGKLAVIQPWEFGRLPQDWVTRARDVDEFWLPSEYVRRVYIESGVPAEKVFVVPNGVDAEKFHPQASPMKLATQKKFKFLFVGGTIGRKGPDLLLQAYLKNFTAADDVCLVIKDFGGKSVYQGQTVEAQIRAIQTAKEAPEILYLNEELPAASLPGLYTACDCLVMPYRGEGFGLPVLEAMACGLPVIVTAGGATDDFVRDEFAFRIPSVKRPIGHEVSGMKLAGEGWLLEPDLNALTAAMRQAFEQPAEARRRGQLASEHARQHFTWKNTAAVVAERIRTLGSATSGPSKPEVKSVTAPEVAHIGQLAEARELFGQKKFQAAWEAAMTAITLRPFHPEACLLLAEIALAAGDANAARQCAQRARDLAPEWNAPKQFLKKPLKGGAKLEWLKLPAPSASRLTVCLIAKNEEKFLAQCLKSVRDLAQQIIVVDTGSTDRTVEIAREFNAEIYSQPWNDDFAAARNATLEHATGDWVLMLDADEELPAAQHAKLLADLKQPESIAHRLPLANAGEEHQGRSFVPRLYRNAPGVFYHGRIHEQVFPSILPLAKAWGLKTTLGTAELLHHGYTKELMRDRNKVERNLKLLRLAIGENPSDLNLVMNLGLELVRSDDLAAGIRQYREAYQMMSAQPAGEVVPELREALLTQFTSQLYKLPAYAEVVEVLTSPLAQNGGLTASLHFSLGLAYFELKQFSEAADQMRQCIAKRKQPALSPINTDIHTAAPNHCLALSLVQLGDAAAAEKAFAAALAETGQIEAVKVDHAKFLAETGREIPALEQLNELVAKNPANTAAWIAGGKIALGKPDFLEFARDWTGEAMKAQPENAAILEQRAEALMLNGDIAGAVELWEKLWSVKNSPTVLAALILCEALERPSTHAPNEGNDETLTSREFISWYQRLLKLQLRPLVERVNEQLEKLGRALPTATQMIENALAEPRVPAQN